MRLTFFVFLVLFLFATGCERKLSAAEVKENLEKAMTTYLQKQQRPGTSPLNFKMLDVDYYQDNDNYYLCSFKVKLYRPDGTDTTGFISGKVSNDFSKVSGR